MFTLRVACTAVVAYLAICASAHGNHKRGAKNVKRSLNPSLPYDKRATNASLSTFDHNSISNDGGPFIYYNGSGPVPSYQELSPVPAPITPVTSTANLQSAFLEEINAIYAKGSYYNSSCSQCMATTEILHLAALTLPVQTFTDLVIDYCVVSGDVYIYALNCYAEFASTPVNNTAFTSGAAGTGAYWAQLYAKMQMSTGDFQSWCYYNFDTCEAPEVILIDESEYFTPKPASAYIAPPPSGETIDVLHLSDWHIDPRYDVGSEADCSQYLCCRPYSTNTKHNTTSANPLVPASRFGYLYCDSPADLALSSFSTMDQFFNKSEIAFTIFTGDIISHDNDDQLSRAYVEYNEINAYQTFHAQLPNSPIYATLGNHDSLPEAYNTPNSFNNGSNGFNNVTNGANIFSWNYDLLSSLWSGYGWINKTEAQYASTHYGAYAHTTTQGLRIISINTDFWYLDNIFNYANITNPDVSGVLKFLADELAACEKAGQRAWVIGHVYSGYNGGGALMNPSSLFYSIIVRFSPATVAAVFFGHTHEDQIQIFYEYKNGSLNAAGLRNTTDVDYTKPAQMGFIGPSITPLTGNNAGYQMMQVDAKTFSVMGIQTYIANVSESLTWESPVWQFEYDARSTYNVGNVSWPKTSPLNATFYDRVTDQMLANISLVETFNLYETKSSIVTKPCNTTACQEAKVCYIRSGSSALGNLCQQDTATF